MYLCFGRNCVLETRHYHDDHGNNWWVYRSDNCTAPAQINSTNNYYSGGFGNDSFISNARLRVVGDVRNCACQAPFMYSLSFCYLKKKTRHIVSPIRLPMRGNTLSAYFPRGNASTLAEIDGTSIYTNVGNVKNYR